MAPARFDKHEEQDGYILKLAQLYEGGDLCDLTIKCGSKRFRVHRHVLAAQCAWFFKACAGNFKESGMSEIELQEDDQDAMAAMINFCYYLEYNDSLKDTKDKPITFSVTMFAIAEKYCFDSLQGFAADRLEYHLEHSWDEADFISAVVAVYENTTDTDRMLRNVIVDAMVRRGDLLSESWSAGLNKLLDTVPGFAADSLRALAKTKTKVVWQQAKKRIYICPDSGCDRRFYAAMHAGETYYHTCCQTDKDFTMLRRDWEQHLAVASGGW